MSSPRGADGADDVAAAGELGGRDQPAPLEHGHAAAGQPPPRRDGARGGRGKSSKVLSFFLNFDPRF